MQQPPRDAQTVPVRVQVIDMEPFALDLVVPTYLPARDLTQRIARDAGLGAYWEDGTRRQFWLRARGRVMKEDERLDDLGVVPHELVHLLPQPPPGSGIQERPPEYPRTAGYAGAGWGRVAAGLLLVLLITGLWGLGMVYVQGIFMSLFPALGLSLLATSLARHLLGGVGSSIRVPAVGAALYFPLLVLALLPVLIFGEVEALRLVLVALPAAAGGLLGVTLGWLSWYGAVEPLPKITKAEIQQQEAVAVYHCGICGLEVQPDVRTACRFGCGKIFHVGCLQARESVHKGDGCAVCGFVPAA